MASGFRFRFAGSTKENGSASESSPKRTLRNRNVPKKYSEFFELSPTKRIRPEKVDSSSSEEDVFDSHPQKSTALFDTDDVEGQYMFQFKSRHTKNDLQNKVRDSITSSPSLGTPRKSLLNKTNEATPKRVKDIIKKRIVKEVESENSDGDFSASSSDFEPDGDKSEESESSVSPSASEDETQDQVQNVTKVQISKKRSDKVKTKDAEYVVTPDNYFLMNSTKKITTSDHTLSRLKNLNIDQPSEEAVRISEEHRISIANLNKSNVLLFDRWLYALSEHFNVLLYGVGSKRSLLHEFQKQKLKGFPCIVVNGYFPSLTIKSILETIIIDLLENSHIPSNTGDVVKLIETQLVECGTELFLIIHNIDGTMLRNAKAQSVLASISQIKNVHTIATVDHINASLLWDHSKLSKFRFTWWDVTTFLPYTEETSYENSLMTQRSGALQLSSLKSVYQSLTTNAKGIFNVIMQHQLENHKQAHYQGLPFKELYSKSREQFLVSSDVALRAQLTEFLDHKLVKMKRSYDGSENLLIPIENTLLQQFLDENN